MYKEGQNNYSKMTVMPRMKKEMGVWMGPWFVFVQLRRWLL
jgi:hypothetical protein